MEQSAFDGFEYIGTLMRVLVADIAYYGGTKEDIERILASRTLRRRIAQAIVEYRHVIEYTGVISVDGTMALADFLRSCHFWPVAPVVTSEFHDVPLGVALDVPIVLFRPNRLIETADVLEEMAELHLRPATLRETIALVIHHPEFHRTFPVVALGSTARSAQHESCVVAYFEYVDLQRGVYCAPYESEWSRKCRFPAVPKAPAVCP